MPRLPRYVIPGQPQHVIQRGNNRSVIFSDTADYRFGRVREALVLVQGTVYLSIKYLSSVYCPPIPGTLIIGVGIWLALD